MKRPLISAIAIIFVIAGCMSSSKFTKKNPFEYKEKHKTDKFSGIETFASTYNPLYTDYPNAVYYLDVGKSIEKSDTSYVFLLSYRGDDWIYLEKKPLKFLINGDVIKTNPGTVSSDNINGNQVIEQGYYTTTKKSIKKVAFADSVKVRINAKSFHDFSIPDSSLMRMQSMFKKITGNDK